MMLNSFIMAFGITVGKITVSMLSAFAIVWFRFPLRNLFFWMIFITLMLPVEVRIFPTVEVIANLKCSTAMRANAAADGLGDRHLPVPPVLYDPAGRAD
jgi:ABC-type glycerol-3-phosphate transport system permease component